MVETAILLDSLRKAGLRITPQRQAICELLATSHEHPTATMIYETLKSRFPSLSLATVYNTLEVLVRLGAVNVLGNAGDGMAHYDADTEPHINLACVSCHKIVDFPSQYVQFLDEEISAASGYRVLGARVLYYGLCPECQQKTPMARRRSDHDDRGNNA